jgi:phosphohistidine phosphatase SixA
MTLVIDLLRHGDAAPANGGSDAARRLTERGRADVVLVAGQLASGPGPVRIFSSPLVRARETADLVANRLPAPLAVERLDALSPDNEPEAVIDALLEQGIETGHVLMVGHQPLLGRLVEHLTGTEPALPPATLVRITCERIPSVNTGRLEKTWSPAALRKP